MFLILSKKKIKDVVSVAKPTNPILNMTRQDTSPSTLKSQLAYIPAIVTNVADEKKKTLKQKPKTNKKENQPRGALSYIVHL